MNQTNNLKYQKEQLEILIQQFEEQIANIKDAFDLIKSKMKGVDGDSDVWSGNSQRAFKEKKDVYVKEFDIITNEFNKQLNLLKRAKNEFSATEINIKSSVDSTINSI